MTSIVRSPKYTAKGWPVHRGPRSNVSALVEAAEREIEDTAEDADRLCREARQRIQAERMREGSDR